MLGLKLNHVSKRGPWRHQTPVWCRYNAVSFFFFQNPHNRHTIAGGIRLFPCLHAPFVRLYMYRRSDRGPVLEVWGVCCEFEVSFTFSCCLSSALGNIVINWAAFITALGCIIYSFIYYIFAAGGGGGGMLYEYRYDHYSLYTYFSIRSIYQFSGWCTGCAVMLYKYRYDHYSLYIYFNAFYLPILGLLHWLRGYVA